MMRTIVSLTLVCCLAGIILGGVYIFTEPTRLKVQKVREEKIVRDLLHLKEKGRVVEIRRYLKEGQLPVVGYLLSDSLHLFTLEGRELKTFSMPPAPGDGTFSKKRDRLIASLFPGSHFAGRFFCGWDEKEQRTGYVVEAQEYGFKSFIRFLVAVGPDFVVRGVEVTAHEEDPGLGAEITRRSFKDQLIGKHFRDEEAWKVVKTPSTKGTQAVTGATISSEALVRGVQKAVEHLHYRLQNFFPREVGP